MSNPIYVTKTFLPPLEEYHKLLQQVWDSVHLTNRGKLIEQLEREIQKFTGCKLPPLLVANGTLAIQFGLKALKLTGEIITTPFSYVATTSSIVWENCTPVFVDIHPEYLTLDEEKLEAAITSNTTGILATHVFGNPCNTEKIREIAEKHNLKVIYDAAHCFGVNYKGKSIFDYGDVSTCSFHATKLFHTAEGGGVFCNTQELIDETFSLHNFGHDGPERFQGLGINGKLSEVNSALGLTLIPYLPEILQKRKAAADLYNKQLSFASFSRMKIRPDTEWNYSYYPILLENESKRNQVFGKLAEQNIHARKYFYPSLNTLPYLPEKSMPVSESVSSRVLCLPFYPNLLPEEQERICTTINAEA